MKKKKNQHTQALETINNLNRQLKQYQFLLEPVRTLQSAIVRDTDHQLSLQLVIIQSKTTGKVRKDQENMTS